MRTGLPVGRGSGRVLPLPRLGTARGQRSCPPPAPRRLENSSSFPQGLGQLRPPAGPAHTPPDRRRLPFDRGERDRLPAVPFGSVIVSGGTGNRFRAESVIFFSGIRTCWNRRAELVPAHPTSRSASRAARPCMPALRHVSQEIPAKRAGLRGWRAPALACHDASGLGRLRWHAKTPARPRAPLRLPALHHVSQEIPAKRAGLRALAGLLARACQDTGPPSRSASPARSPSCFAGDSCEACWIARTIRGEVAADAGKGMRYTSRSPLRYTWEEPRGEVRAWSDRQDSQSRPRSAEGFGPRLQQDHGPGIGGSGDLLRAQPA